MKICKFCGALIINEICPVCNRTFITPPTLMNRTLFDLNPYLKKRLEWRENIRHHAGMAELPIDPTKFNLEDIPPKNVPDEYELLLRKKRKEDSDRFLV
ncbi:MAG: hypothetical protein ACTSRS_02010 [Candidatus Helarchaeota archaeon]